MKLSYRVHLIPYKDFRDHCEKCGTLLSKVVVGNPHRVTVYCGRETCASIEDKCLLCEENEEALTSE